jgi:hypothetical protein
MRKASAQEMNADLKRRAGVLKGAHLLATCSPPQEYLGTRRRFFRVDSSACPHYSGIMEVQLTPD